MFNLNLKVEPGQLIGIAGAVGSGKSSVISGKPTYLPTYCLIKIIFLNTFFYCSHCWRIETFIWKISNFWTSCACTTTGTYTLFRNKRFFSLWNGPAEFSKVCQIFGFPKLHVFYFQFQILDRIWSISLSMKLLFLKSR